MHKPSPSISFTNLPLQQHLTTTDKRKQSPSSEELTEYKRVTPPLTTMTIILPLKQLKDKRKIVG